MKEWVDAYEKGKDSMRGDMRTIYIAGRYRGKDTAEVGRNIKKAREAAKELSKRGWATFCPHMNTAFFDGICTDDFWLKCGLEFLIRCDAIFMLSNYSHSQGAMKELVEAMKHDKEIYFEDKGYPDANSSIHR